MITSILLSIFLICLSKIYILLLFLLSQCYLFHKVTLITYCFIYSLFFLLFFFNATFYIISSYYCWQYFLYYFSSVLWWSYYSLTEDYCCISNLFFLLLFINIFCSNYTSIDDKMQLCCDVPIILQLMICRDYAVVVGMSWFF